MDVTRGVQRLREMFMFVFLAILSKASFVKAGGAGAGEPPHDHYHDCGSNTSSTGISTSTSTSNSCSYCLSWRMSVEANNVIGWRTIPAQCFSCIEAYMTRGQYEHDLNFITHHVILTYIDTITLSDDGMDAWIFDVDDTCISNLFYYKGKRYGCDPYDPTGFKSWALKEECPAIGTVLELFRELIERGFKVFLITGRDEHTMGYATINNLHNQGFLGYCRLILRSEAYKGQSAVEYKSEIRKKLVGEGYRIWGNVGDQWSDLQGQCLGDRSFKLPNPMYFVP